MYLMILVGIGWLFVTLLMAVVEATSTTGTVLGAIVTFLFYGLLPLAVVLYLLNTPARRRAQRAAWRAALPSQESAPTAPASAAASATASGAETTAVSTAMSGAASGASHLAPDHGSHAPGDPVAPKREKP